MELKLEAGPDCQDATRADKLSAKKGKKALRVAKKELLKKVTRKEGEGLARFFDFKLKTNMDSLKTIIEEKSF